MENFKSNRLAAVNTIISNIGQAPVTALDSGNPLVESAELVLDSTINSVLSEGWEYNTERDYPFTPGPDGTISIPLNVLALSGLPGNGQQLVIRNNKVYDRVGHTFKFSEKQCLNVVWLFDYDDLPEPFKNYITIRAANLFAGRSVGSKEAVMFGQQEEIIARATLMEYETQQGQYSIFNDREGGNRYNQRASRPLNVVYRF